MPSRILALSSLIFGLLTVALPYSPLRGFLDFYPPSPLLLIVIGLILLMYFLTVESAKHIFNRTVP
jgi:Mg2+-importing ATPase